MQVELVYERACPNRDRARVQLLRAFAQSGIAPRWKEWDSASPEAPARVRVLGSPTILVDGRDAGGEGMAGEGASCRIYDHHDSAGRGVPAVEAIVAALRSAQSQRASGNGRTGWKLNGALLPALGLALVPKIFCPACWPAYAGLLGSMGLGFVDYSPWLLPLTTLFLIVAVIALGWRARDRRGFGPLLLGVSAAAVLLLGKFWLDSDPLMYAGLALLIAASVWNTWPRSPGLRDCPACGPD